MAAYYNEIEPYAAEWLRNLIKAGHIPHGEVDTRSIVDVAPDDLRGFTQCHFFAGIGGWGHALRLAGWPDDRPIWTGSCPCQPFSVAGKGTGTDDPRHLWPHFHRLIAACRPPVVLGEQVAGKAGYGWLDGVRADLEREGYASRGADLPALAVNAPHIRQRLYWVACDMGNANDARLEGRGGAQRDEQRADGQVEPCSVHDHMADADQGGRGRRPCDGDGERDGQAGERHEDHRQPAGGGEDRIDVDDAQSGGRGQGIADARGVREGDSSQGPTGRSAQYDSASFWNDHVWLAGADGKARRFKPGIRLLAYGVSGGLALVRTRKDGAEETHTYNRVGALRAFGNAIVPSLAAEVVRAFMETENATTLTNKGPTMLGMTDTITVTISITGIELLALKNLSMMSHALAHDMPGIAGQEQAARAKVLEDTIRKIEVAGARR